MLGSHKTEKLLTRNSPRAWSTVKEVTRKQGSKILQAHSKNNELHQHNLKENNTVFWKDKSNTLSSGPGKQYWQKKGHLPQTAPLVCRMGLWPINVLSSLSLSSFSFNEHFLLWRWSIRMNKQKPCSRSEQAAAWCQLGLNHGRLPTMALLDQSLPSQKQQHSRVQR